MYCFLVGFNLIATYPHAVWIAKERERENESQRLNEMNTFWK